MAVTEIKNEPWCKQEGETPNQFYWFQKYLNYPYNDITKFHKQMVKECEENGKKSTKTVPLCTLKTMYNWSYQNKWIKRKEEYVIWESEENTNYLRQVRLQNQKEEIDLLHQIKMMQLENIWKQVENGQLNGYNFNQNLQGIKVIEDMDKLSLGERTENVKQELSANVTQESKSNDEILLKVADMKKERKDADEEK